jgi:hypothetical protein
MPAFALISSYLRLFCLEMFEVRGIDGAYPDPGLNVDAMVELGKSGGSILICYS